MSVQICATCWWTKDGGFCDLELSYDVEMRRMMILRVVCGSS